MAAFVMAYSFTEQKSATDNVDDDDDETNDAAPAMVPMADILNHITNNNAHLEFGAKTLSMVATQNIFKVQFSILDISDYLKWGIKIKGYN